MPNSPVIVDKLFIKLTDFEGLLLFEIISLDISLIPVVPRLKFVIEEIKELDDINNPIVPRPAAPIVRAIIFDLIKDIIIKIN